MKSNLPFYVAVFIRDVVRVGRRDVTKKYLINAIRIALIQKELPLNRFRLCKDI
jgi:hypothetical protein